MNTPFFKFEIRNSKFEIINKNTLTPITKLFVVKAPLVAQRAQPGQFVIVRVKEEGERIPLTIADFGDNSITIVVQEVGRTSRLLGNLGVGDTILDLVGPLGTPIPLENIKSPIVCIGGGFGAAAIYPIVKALKNKVITILGARSKELIIMEEELQEVSTKVYPCTDDGSYGYHGLVTGKLKELIERGTSVARVIAIGPMSMMRATAATTLPYQISTWVSLDPIMVDGTGLCGACRVSIAGKTRFACVDGPFFDAHQVDFAELLLRSKMYLKEQEIALEKLQEKNVH